MGEILKASGVDYSSVVKTTIMYVLLNIIVYPFEFLNLISLVSFVTGLLTWVTSRKSTIYTPNVSYLIKCSYFVLNRIITVSMYWFYSWCETLLTIFFLFWCRLPSSFSSTIHISSRSLASKRQDRDRMHCNTLEHHQTRYEEWEKMSKQIRQTMMFLGLFLSYP